MLLGGIISVAATAKVTLNIYESDGQTLFDGRNVMVGTELKLMVASDANDFWSGGLFISGGNRDLAVLSGSGKDPLSWDWSDCHLTNAGPESLAIRWEDSVIEGFDLFSDVNCLPGDWFVIDYMALAPGEPNVGFYEHSVSWNDPNQHVTLYQVPEADFNLDGIVNLLDYSLLSYYWMEEDCTDPDGCQITDLYSDGTIDLKDLLLFADDWLWGGQANEPNDPTPVDPVPDPNLIYQIVDANGLDEITIDIGQTVTLYVDMATFDVNEIWVFEIEADLSDPNLGMIDNTARDPNNPPGDGTARILAGPNRWTLFDFWGPGHQQREGIYLMGTSSGVAFEEGHLASFEFTCRGAGDVELSLVNCGTTSISGDRLYPTLKGILIHQNEPSVPVLKSLATSTLSIAEQTVPSISPDEMVQFLEEIWLADDTIQDVIKEDDWNKFIDAIKIDFAIEAIDLNDTVIYER